MFNFVEIKFLWVSNHGYLWSVICLRYNICSAWFLDIRKSICFMEFIKIGQVYIRGLVGGAWGGVGGGKSLIKEEISHK